MPTGSYSPGAQATLPGSPIKMETIVRRRVASISCSRGSSGEGGVARSSSKRSILSMVTNGGGDMDSQPRSRLMTLSGIRQMRSGSCSGSRPGSHNHNHASQNAEKSSGSSSSSSTNVVASDNGSLQIGGMTGLSNMQVEVLRQISLDALHRRDPIIYDGMAAADLAILERKWSNMSMAQNIRGMQAMLAETPSIVNRADFVHGYTALHWAAKLDNSPMVNLLLSYNADIDTPSNNGSTPLHIASRLGHERIIKLLVNNCAVITTRDHGGRLPKDLIPAFVSQRVKDLINANKHSGTVSLDRHILAPTPSALSHTPTHLAVDAFATPPRPDSSAKPRFRERIATGLRMTRPSIRRRSHPSSPVPLLMLSGRNGDSHATSAAGGGPFVDALKQLDKGKARRRLPGHQLRGDAARLPLAWVPAVRKRALEVEFHDGTANNEEVVGAATDPPALDARSADAPVVAVTGPPALYSVPETTVMVTSPEKSLSAEVSC